MKEALFISLCIFFLAGCATTTTMRKHYFKSYSIGTEQKANVGTSMLTFEDITYIEGKRWVGLLNSEDGWEYFKYLSDDSLREELIYTGRSGNTIHISYREYKKELARPAFYQELTYDLGESDIIVFRDYKIKVLDATNEYIRFLVLAEQDVPHEVTSPQRKTVTKDPSFVQLESKEVAFTHSKGNFSSILSVTITLFLKVDEQSPALLVELDIKAETEIKPVIEGSVESDQYKLDIEREMGKDGFGLVKSISFEKFFGGDYLKGSENKPVEAKASFELPNKRIKKIKDLVGSTITVELRYFKKKKSLRWRITDVE